jgi:hypothetical protein
MGCASEAGYIPTGFNFDPSFEEVASLLQLDNRWRTSLASELSKYHFLLFQVH